MCLDLNEVRMFVQVVRARSFAEASRRLGVPPNTLSRRVRQLEAALDTRLDAALDAETDIDRCGLRLL